jgi:hypothetical protein
MYAPLAAHPVSRRICTGGSPARESHAEERASLYTLIDTFPAFLACWAEVEKRPPEIQIEAWATAYMSQWPELLAKQIEDYATQNLDWRQPAREKVFPYLVERLPAMRAAHQHLLKACGPIHGRAQQVLDFDMAITFVIYAGIGCGAGWATTYGNTPAILFGLENIAECGWSDPGTLKGLIAHEIGHLVHSSWRSRNGIPTGSGPWWQLYEEGFAQTCESRILDTEVGHQAGSSPDSDWLKWCQANRGWLAAEFLRTVDAGQPVSAFFGSWFEIQGHSETGYFLGQAVITALERQSGLKEIALLEESEAAARPILEKMAGGAAVKGDQAA